MTATNNDDQVGEICPMMLNELNCTFGISFSLAVAVMVMVRGRPGLWPSWFVAVLVCGRPGLWPSWFVAIMVVADMV